MVGNKAKETGKDRWCRHLGVTEGFEIKELSGHIYLYGTYIGRKMEDWG